MKPIAVLDNETDPFQAFRSPRAFLTGWFNGSRIRSFWSDKVVTVSYRGQKLKLRECVWDCWKSVRRELRGYYIYWHNGGKFDAREFMPLLKLDGFELLPIKGRMARFRHPDDGTEFRDSFCLLPVGLKKTGGKLDIDYAKLEKAVRWRHREEILTYWKQDLRVLYDKVTEFVSLYGFGMTMAGRTFDQLKKNFNLNPPRTDESHDSQFRPFYFGGRVQFFQLGQVKGTFKVIDINSAYPYAMLKNHAFGLEFESGTKLPRVRQTLRESFIRFDGICSGGLPFRLPDGSLSFGPHEGEFAVTGWEFDAVRRAGGVVVKRIHEVLTPTETENFGTFVTHFYQQKRMAEKGSSEELFAKLFLNSTYGRFALNARDYRDVVMSDYGEEPKENQQWRKRIQKLVKEKHPGIRGDSFQEKCRAYWEGFDGKWTRANDFEDIRVTVWERPSEIRSNAFFNVATAASITGCVRSFLYESLAKCKGVAYCDTDSIICTDTGKLPLSAELGQWKLEGVSEPNQLYIGGKKLYALKLNTEHGGKWKLASKGVRLTAEELIRVAKGESVKSTNPAPTFSLYTTHRVKGSKSDFITRTVVRDDLRKRRKVAA